MCALPWIEEAASVLKYSMLVRHVVTDNDELEWNKTCSVTRSGGHQCVLADCSEML